MKWFGCIVIFVVDDKVKGYNGCVYELGFVNVFLLLNYVSVVNWMCWVGILYCWIENINVWDRD